jgi:hypothetical protein
MMIARTQSGCLASTTVMVVPCSARRSSSPVRRASSVAVTVSSFLLVIVPARHTVRMVCIMFTIHEIHNIRKVGNMSSS